MSRIRTLNDVVAWRLCVGCGACAFICPQHKVELRNYVDEGIRPQVAEHGCGDCRLCLEVCPAVGAEDLAAEAAPPANQDAARVLREWGHMLELWEGHAVDEEIRFKGSSGGVLTALSAYCLEKAGLHGVLQVAADPDDPVQNRTRLSRTRDELLPAMGSRYSPASVCDQLGCVERAPAPCAVVGKPAEITALRRVARRRPALAEKIGVTMSFFCAETPATAGTLALVRQLGIDPRSLASLRYRGFGWPGDFAPIGKGEASPRATMPYRESWRFLQHYRPWSVQLWPDGAGEDADIVCGDPWHQKTGAGTPGISLLLARTETGRRVIHGAIEAGYVQVDPAAFPILATAQSSLLQKRRSVWGRSLALAVFGLPAPHLRSRSLFRCWWEQPVTEKLRTVLGTARRVVTRRLYRRLRLDRGKSNPIKPVLLGPPAPTPIASAAARV